MHHTELFFPGRSDEFCKQLVLTFHEVCTMFLKHVKYCVFFQMNGGSDLPTGGE